jgi:hypothetical protein
MVNNIFNEAYYQQEIIDQGNLIVGSSYMVEVTFYQSLEVTARFNDYSSSALVSASTGSSLAC